MALDMFAAIIIVGAIFLAIGIFGGGIEIGGAKVPSVSGWLRAVSALIGTVMLALGMVLNPGVRVPPPLEPVSVPSATITDIILTTPTTEQTISFCPNLVEKGKGIAWDMNIDVPAGEIAFIDAWGFDDRSAGVFVVITGPYKGHHVIRDGAFCGGIPITANYEPVKQQRMGYMQSGFQEVHLP
jgi:hypothetical protein